MSSRSTIEPSTRGKRLHSLRKELGLSQEILADMAGLPRSEISNAERDAVQWQSDRLWRGLIQAFGIERVELQGYLDSDPKYPLKKVAAAAEANADRALKTEARLRQCDLVAREAMEAAGIDDADPLAPHVFLFMQTIVRREGASVPRPFLINRAMVAREHMVDAERALLSYKSVSEVVRARR